MIRSFREFRFFKSFRIPLETSDEVQFIVRTEDGVHEKAEIIKDAVVTNVSITGLGFITKSELMQDEEVDISISYKKLRFEVSAKVVRIMNNPHQSGQLSYGAEINELEDRDKMRRFLTQLINYFQPDRLKQCLRDLALAEKYADMNEGLESLSLLISIYREVGLYGKNEKFINTLLEEAVRVLGATRAGIFLINTEKNELEAAELNGYSVDKSTLKFDFRQGVLGQVFTTGLGLNLDAQSEQLKIVEKDNIFKCRSLIALPISNGDDKVVGVIQFENKRGEDRFSEEDDSVARVLSLVFSSLYKQFRPVSEKSLVRRFSAPQSRSVIFIGRSDATTELRKSITKLKDSAFPVVICGERGTGKSLYAKILHVEGARSDKEFDQFMCLGQSNEEMEKQIWGTSTSVGMLGKCQNGTLCLEEITHLPINLQIKLLEFINSPAENRNSKVNVRILFTSSESLEVALKEQKLHPELYVYMSQYVVNIKPLRERKKDLADLIDYFLVRECKKQGFLPKVLGDDLKEKFMDYPWPGNVTELTQAIGRLVLYHPKQHVITDVEESTLPIVEHQLTPSISTDIPFVNNSDIELKDRLALVEREMIYAEIKRCKGNKSKAAKEMGISREALRKKLIASNEVWGRLTGHTIPVEGDDNLAEVIDISETKEQDKKKRAVA